MDKQNKQLEIDIKRAGLTGKHADMVRRKYKHFPAVSYLHLPEFQPNFNWDTFRPVVDLDAVYERQA